MKLCVAVVGESNWKSTDEWDVISFANCRDLCLYLHGDSLNVFVSGRPWRRLDAVLWRLQFDQDSALETTQLQIIEASGVPCINSAKTMLSFGSRIGSYAAMSKAGLPIVTQTILSGTRNLSFLKVNLPIVLKCGNAHMGYGKAVCRTPENWEDFCDVAHLMDQFVCVEPLIPYIRDIRCLCILGKFFVLERIPSRWKANVDPVSVQRASVPKEILAMSKEAAMVLNSDIVGIDWLQQEDGKWVVLEANLSPGLVGHGRAPIKLVWDALLKAAQP